MLNYRISGDDLQTLIVELAAGEGVLAEAGAMVMMQDGVRMEAIFGGKPHQSILGKLVSAGKRLIVGESLFMTLFINETTGPRQVHFAGPYPGKIMPIDLSEHGGEVICQKDAFLCASPDTEIDIAFQRRLRTGLFGGEGFILERLTGRGTAFIHASGTVIPHTLGPGEVIHIDTGCLVAFTPSVDYDVRFVRGIRNMLFGGEGLFLVRMAGPGRVWTQSLPFSRLAQRVLRYGAAGGKGEGSILGKLWNMTSGD